MSTYNGWTIVTPPATPVPASIEAQYSHPAGVVTNPFTQQQQIQDWSASLYEISVSMPPMVQSDAQAWIAFIKSCAGTVNVFQFVAGFAAAFPESLTTDGTNQPYWRLKDTPVKWSVKAGKVYGLTFECRQAI